MSSKRILNTKTEHITKLPSEDSPPWNTLTALMRWRGQYGPDDPQCMIFFSKVAQIEPSLVAQFDRFPCHHLKRIIQQYR